jgi:hypothetical protein
MDISHDHTDFGPQILFLGPGGQKNIFSFSIDGYFSRIKNSLGSQKLGFGSSKPIPKYFCIWFRLTFGSKSSSFEIFWGFFWFLRYFQKKKLF